MRDISKITGLELPSKKQLLLSTFIALLTGMTVLVLGILPAEYGMDPTGLGKRMGLTKLHQEDVTEEKLADKTISIVTSDFLQKRDEKWRSDKINLTLPAKQGLEVKALLKQGEKMLFHWQSSNEKVSVDMHGNVINASDDDFTSYWTGDQETQAAGTFTAPFSGLHGWYWENKSDRSVNIVLTTEGYYQDLGVH